MDAWARIEGAQALIEWFGRAPRFHDGYVLGLKLEFPGRGELVLHGWSMTDRVDAQGYFELERHFVATFVLDGVQVVDLTEFAEGAILDRLAVTEVDEVIRLELDPIIGVGGVLQARHVAVTFVPGKPAA
jgi:hypothetical protein